MVDEIGDDYYIIKLKATLLRLKLDGEYIKTHSMLGAKECGDHYERLFLKRNKVK